MFSNLHLARLKELEGLTIEERELRHEEWSIILSNLPSMNDITSFILGFNMLIDTEESSIKTRCKKENYAPKAEELQYIRRTINKILTTII